MSLRFMQSIWQNQPWPSKTYICPTTTGPCASAAMLAHFFLKQEDADAIEYELDHRRTTQLANNSKPKFEKEFSYVFSQMTEPTLLCIVGAGNLVMSCSAVDHRGRREVLADEAMRLYNQGVPLVSVDFIETFAVHLRVKPEHLFKKCKLQTPRCGALIVPSSAPSPASKNRTEQLLEHTRNALKAVGW